MIPVEAAAPKTLLIVDDDLAFSRILAWAFEDMGYAVWNAADCQQARASARSMSFDFALVDYHLPDGDGRSLSRAMTQMLPKLQIVLMSGNRAAASADSADAGVEVAFIDKPLPLARVHGFFSATADLA